MLIKTLVENTSVSDAYRSEHGLSIYIETKKHKLLFDLGASGLFAENAEKIGIDLAAVDTVVISHGHYDHGGGLKTFLNINKRARIYLQQSAFEKHYANKPDGKKTDIGLDHGLISDQRLIFVDHDLIIDEELEIFSRVETFKLNPSGNLNLLMGQGSSIMRDDFSHEQNLIIHENGKTLLLTGCAHKGIVNIMAHFKAQKQDEPDYVIGGFHLYNRSRDNYEDVLILRQIAEYLKNTGSTYFTCHCTGIDAYYILKDLLGEQINYMATGSELII